MENQQLRNIAVIMCVGKGKWWFAMSDFGIPTIYRSRRFRSRLDEGEVGGILRSGRLALGI
jgi:hypothetical protein